MKKKLTIVLGTVSSALISVIAIHLIIVAAVFTAIMTYDPEEPPKPQITYGEFPFKLVYELNGEMKIIEDVIICEYMGTKKSGAGYKVNTWKKYLKSGSNEIILLDLRYTNDKGWNNRPILNLYFDYGSASDYMGARKIERIAQPFDYVSYCYKAKNGDTHRFSMPSEEAWEKYKIRLISWECAPPIENEFV